MPKKTDFYKGLKLLGTEKEQKLNDKIREAINRRSFIESLSKESKQQVPRINRFQEASERLSIVMNYPTKKDVENVAKLVIQLEEKVDKIEELLLILAEEKKGSHRKDIDTRYPHKKKKISDFLYDSLLSNTQLKVKGLR